MEQRTRDFCKPSTTEEHDSFPIPIEPLRSISSTNKPKRSSMHSNDSGIISPLASSRSPVLSSAIATETSTPHQSSSQQSQTDQLSPREHLSSIQQLVRNSANRMARNSVKSRSKELKYNHSQPNYPDSHSVLRTFTRQGYKFWSPLYYCHIFVTFILHAPSFWTRNYCFYLIPDYLEHDGYDSPMRTIQLPLYSLIQLLLYISYNFYKNLQKIQKYFLFCSSKEESRTVRYCTRHIKRPPRAKRPPTTGGAERITLFRESRPTPPTYVIFLSSPQRPKFHKGYGGDIY